MVAVIGAAAIALLWAAAGGADAWVKRTTVRCCYELSVQVGGSQNVDYGDGTGAYPSFRGRYVASWRFSFRALVKLIRASGHEQLDAVAPFRRELKPGRML
jgi:hypothetical protein